VTSIQNCIANTQSKAGFVLGVSAIELGNGTIKGRHCETFDYSAKTVTAEEKIIAEEIKRVRGLKTDGQWVQKKYPPTWTIVRK
jgi:hypothetical protein